jgi:predicted secreted protein
MRSAHLFFAAAFVALSLSTVACGGASDDANAQDDSTESDVKGATPVKLTASDDNKTVKVTAGQPVEITLSQNASTGYSWSVSDDGGLGTAKEKTNPGDVSRPGSSGTDTFTWKTTNKVGSFDLELIYQRPWAETSPPARTVHVTLEISPKGGGAGKMCGGIAGITCGKGEFCSYTTKAACGAGDQSGTCTALPDMCPMVIMPVCGCDGKTYNNSCEANRGGVSVASNGQCTK